MLSVIASLPPKQLQKLDSITSGTDLQGKSLSWEDFCGYDDVKIMLKKLLRMSKKEMTEKKYETTDVLAKCDPSASVPPPASLPATDLFSALIPASVQGLSPLPVQTLRQSLQISSDKVRGIVLYGPSGCGKSFLARIIAAEAKMNFVAVKSTDLLSKYFGQTEASIRGLFKQVRAAAPCVLFFDEFDVLAYKR